MRILKWAVRGARPTDDLASIYAFFRAGRAGFDLPEGDWEILLAHLGGELVGAAAFRAGRRTCEGLHLFVSPLHRGGGIGRALLRRMQREASVEGCQDVKFEGGLECGNLMDFLVSQGFVDQGPSTGTRAVIHTLEKPPTF